MMRRWLVLLALVAIWLGVAFVELVAGSPPSGLPTAAVGLALLASLAAGETLARVGVPRLVGYLGAGVVLGPAVTGLLDAGVTWRLVPVETTALALLAFQAGYTVPILRRRGGLRPTLTVATTSLLLVPLVTGTGALALAPLLPGLPADGGGVTAFALLAAAIALASSPVVIGAVLTDGRADGRLSDASLGTAVLLAVLAPLVVGLALVAGGDGILADGGALPAVALRSAGLAIAAAVLVLPIVRVLGERALVPILILVVIGLPVLTEAGGDPVVTFALAGLLARRAGGASTEALDRTIRAIGLPAAVVYFPLAAADLTWPALWPVAAVAIGLFFVRAFGFWLGAAAGAHLSREPALQGTGWLAFLPQGALALALVSLATAGAGGFAALAGDALELTIALNLLLGPLLLKLAVRRAGELPREAEGEDAPEEGGEAEPAPEAEVTPAAERPDPLLEVEGPREATPNREWRRSLQNLVLLRNQLRTRGVQARIDRIGEVLRITGGQARQTIQIVSKTCERAEDADTVRAALLEHRESLALQNLTVLEEFAPPSLDEDAMPVLHLLQEQVEAVVREAPAELLVPETRRLLEAQPGDPPWVRAVKPFKRAFRAAQRVFGRPRPTRTVPFRRIVRRVVAGELVARMSALETLVARAEFKAFRRLETLLRNADWVLVDAVERVDEGASPAEIHAFVQDCLLGLREASKEAQADLLRLADEPMLRFSEEAARAARRIAELGDVAGTFALRDKGLRYAAVAPQVREAVAAADGDRVTWGARQKAILDRIVLGLRLVELKGQLRQVALGEALGPPQRMHARIGELLGLALDRTGVARDKVARGQQATPDVLKDLLDELRRRVARPAEGVVHALRSAGVIDRLVGSLDTVTAPLPERVSLLPEAEIVALLRGRPTAGDPVPVAVRRVSRDFFDQRITVRLVEHMRALETSAEEAVAGIRDAMRLLTLQVGREDRASEEAVDEGAVEAPGEQVEEEAAVSGEEPTPETPEQARANRLVDTLDAVTERLDREISQASDTGEALLREVGRTETGAAVELWSRLQEEAARGRLEHAAQGVRRWAADIRPRIAAHPRVASIREGWSRLRERIAAARGRVEARADVTIGGPERIRRAVRELAPTERDLPYVYGKLFSLDPTENDAFVIDRELELEALKLRLQQRDGGAVALVGSRGSGRSSLARVALGRGTTERPIVWLEADRPFHDPARLRKWVARATGITDAELTARGVASELRQRAPIIVIDGLERLVERSARGLEAMDGLAALVAATSRSTLWVMTVESEMLELLGEVSPLGDLFGMVVRLRPLDAPSIRAAVERRHRLSGLDLTYRAPRRFSLRRLRWRIGRTSSDKEYFRHLTALSRGNPRTALQLWTLSLHPLDDRHYEVRPAPDPDLREMSFLPPHLSTAVAVALSHGVVDRQHLELALGWSRVRARAALQALAAAGLVVSRPRTDGEVTWTVPPWAEPSIRRHLDRLGLRSRGRSR